MGVGQDYGRIFRSSTERRVVSGGKRRRQWAVQGPDGEEGPGLRDDGDARLQVVHTNYSATIASFLRRDRILG